jgi:hypothetical protein
MKPTFHAEIGLGHYQLFLKCKVPNEIKKKALSAAESPHDNTERSAFITDSIQILKQRGDFSLSANLDEMKPLLWN